MPLYFAYGSNMNVDAMRLRCPKSQALGPAQLVRHRFFIMSSGYASVKRDARTDVHGVLYDLALSDVPGLDRYEQVGRGLYTKLNQPVLRKGAAPMRAILYVGRDQQSGSPHKDYIAGVLAAARGWNLPEAYLTYLETFAGMKLGASREALPRQLAVQAKNP